MIASHSRISREQPNKKFHRTSNYPSQNHDKYKSLFLQLLISAKLFPSALGVICCTTEQFLLSLATIMPT